MSQPQYPQPQPAHLHYPEPLYERAPHNERERQYAQDAGSVPIQPLPFSEPYTLARDYPPYDPEPEQPFSMQPAPAPRKGTSRWLIAVGILCVVLVAACVGVFAVIGFGAKSVSDKIVKNQRAAVADVTVTGCRRNTSTGRMAASVTIVNHGPDTASYIVDIAFDSISGKAQFDGGVATADHIDGGATTTVVVDSQSAASVPFSCQIVDATRF